MALINISRWSDWLRWMRNKYRLVILNDETFEEKASLRLSRMNLFVLFSMLFMTFLLLFTSLVLFTPVKQYIPGYGDRHFRSDLIGLNAKIDSLETANRQKDAWLQNVRNLLEGNVGSEFTPVPVNMSPTVSDSVLIRNIIPADSLLRLEMLNESQLAVMFETSPGYSEALASLHFFKPVDGIITAQFDPSGGHPAVDLVAPEKSPVKSVLDGTVILSDWTFETGHVIAIQHTNNLISIYKHNSVLLKKTGTFVRAGEAIAIIGNSGELTSGPHLHFEMWHRGVAVNPEEYIQF